MTAQSDPRPRALVVAARRMIRAMSWLAGAGIVALILPTVIDVAHRMLLGPSLPGFIEYSEVGLVIVIFLGIGGAMMERVHIYTPVLTGRLSQRAAIRVRLFGLVLVWALTAVMVVGTTNVAYESFSVGEFRFGLVQVAIWPAKIAIPIGLAALLLEVSIQIYDTFLAIVRTPVDAR